MLDKYNNNSFGLSIITKGRERKTVYYNLKADNLFNISKEDSYISGFIHNIGFSYDNRLSIYTEDNEYITKEEKSPNINIESLKEVSLNELLASIK